VWGISFALTAIFGGVFVVDAEAALVMLVIFAMPLGEVLTVALSGKFVLTTQQKSIRLLKIRILQKRSGTIQWICIAISFSGALYLAKTFGTPLFKVGSFGDLAEIGRMNARGIFRGELEIPFFAKIAFMFLQFGVILSGFSCASQSGRKKYTWTVLLFFTAILWTLITTQRSYFVACAVWWVGAYLTAKVYVGEERRVLKPRVILAVLAAAIVLPIMIVSVRSIRTGNSLSSNLGQAFESSRAWFAGYIPGFSAWYTHWNHQLDFGGSLFGGIVSILSLGQVGDSGASEAGFYAIGAGATTNALTLLRFVIGSFGVIGGALLLILFAFLARYTYDRCRAGSLTAAAMLPAIFVTIIWSPNSWFFGYGSRLIAVLLCLIGFHTAQYCMRFSRHSTRASNMLVSGRG